jgi:hypothetical protein
MQNNLILYIRGTSDIPVVRTAASNITSLRICKRSLSVTQQKMKILQYYICREKTRGFDSIKIRTSNSASRNIYNQFRCR